MTMTLTSAELARKLQEPFPPEDIEWRVGRSGIKNDKPWATVFAYVTARAVHERLDAVVGPGNWTVQYQFVQVDGKPGILAGISIHIGAEWVTKWDGAEPTDVESFKGGLSDATKRAAVAWGIGRYLYRLDTAFANIHEKGKHRSEIKDDKGAKTWVRWDPPALPSWALPNSEPRN